jgi:6,7-dimethyl-8-ribityllumazine synthase
MSNYRIIDGASQLVRREGAAGNAALGRRVAVVAARFNADIVERMVPLLARKLAATGRYDAIVALGCVIRGDTAHFDFVAGEAARGIADTARDTGLPVIFGVLTTENVEQALARARTDRMDKGGEAMDAALEMVLVLHQISLP